MMVAIFPFLKQAAPLFLVFSCLALYTKYSPPLHYPTSPHSSLESHMVRSCFVGFLLLGISLFIGCSGNKISGKVPVSGSVSLKGAPLSEGVIQFEPLEKQNTTASVVLIGGNFSISAANGLQPGMYLVRVLSNEGESKPLNPNAPLTPSGNNLPGKNKTEAKKPIIPAEWNEKSKQQAEVKAEGPNKFDFDIK